ncbi:MAG TPA: hypothetical protein GX745_02515 [Clostridiales bacterium]|nr:hypothetical protein [Clostridiales bacterium]
MEEDDSNLKTITPKKQNDIDQRQKKKTKKNGPRYWSLKAFFITILLSVIFNILSSIAMTGAGIAVIVSVIIVLIIIGAIFDMIGMAVASCDEKPFYAMAAKKVKGAKVSLKLIKNSDIVGSVCSDIIGDICNIISGTASASLILIITINSDSLIKSIISIAIGAVVAAVTVGLKAVFKKFAVTKSIEIVSAVGKMLSVFSR